MASLRLDSMTFSAAPNYLKELDATIAASGGSMASLFGGTYRIFVVGASAGVLIEQITPTRSAGWT